MTNKHQFQPIHGHSKEYLYKRWYSLKLSAKKYNVKFDLGDYEKFKELVADVDMQKIKITRINRLLGYSDGNIRFSPKLTVKTKKRKKRIEKRIERLCETSPNWIGF